MRVMAIDYGDAHTGVAISDPFGMLAGWTTTIDSWRQEVVLARLLDIIREHGVDELVLGLPKNMNDTSGPGWKRAVSWPPCWRRPPAWKYTCGMSG